METFGGFKKGIDFSKPYICLGDSSGIKNAYNQVKWDVFQVLSEIVDRLRGITPQIIFVDGYSGGNEDINELVKKKRLGRVNLNNCNYHDLYHVLEGASLFISGRWHASILCTLANTPILLWGSDSHKTKSLYTLLEYKYPFFEVATLPVNIDELIRDSTSDNQMIVRQYRQIWQCIARDMRHWQQKTQKF
mgnify:CR=1 FL=1